MTGLTRRSMFKFLAAAPVAAVVLPAIPAEPKPKPVMIPFLSCTATGPAPAAVNIEFQERLLKNAYAECPHFVGASYTKPWRRIG